jgi:hypothetical protein
MGYHENGVRNRFKDNSAQPPGGLSQRFSAKKRALALKFFWE